MVISGSYNFLLYAQGWRNFKDETGFDPRCFMSASILSGAFERIKSKVILTYPRNVEVVDLMESLLRGGYSSVHTRLGFDTEMFTPKSAEYMKRKDDIIEQLRNLRVSKIKCFLKYLNFIKITSTS